MIEVLDPGYYITIQDRGRFGYSNYGVPQSGCMDMFSAKNANLILSNSISEPLFEICMMGGKFLFKKETKISLSGALFEVVLNDQKVYNDLSIEVKKGDVLTFGRAKKGNRIYLAVKGGIDCKSVMGSSSMYKGISEDFIVRKKDIFKFSQNPSNNLSYEMVDLNIFDEILNVYKGPEFGLLTSDDKNLLFNKNFSITSNNRMGYFLKEKLNSNSNSIITSPTIPGIIQLTPAGDLIILMKDGQVTGGYPRILQLDEKSISCLSQKNTGNKFTFKLVP
tara:strand:- start:898 stop:1731 length:834 start_codon:yes stop_codon:yes gene_type:complete